MFIFKIYNLITEESLTADCFGKQPEYVISDLPNVSPILTKARETNEERIERQPNGREN